MGEDWKRIIDEGADRAKAAADAATQAELDKIKAEANNLAAIFDELKLTDEATYKQLIAVVDDATHRNESLANVITRLKSLGEAGKKLFDTVGNLSTGGALKAVRAALKR